MEKKFSLLTPLVALFAVLLVTSNIVAQKFWDFKIFGALISLDMGTILLFPVLYIFSDVLVEVWGYATSRRVTWIGFSLQVLAAIVFSVAIIMPHSEYFTNQGAFKAVLGQVPYLVGASLCGYLTGSFLNDSIMTVMKVWMIKWDPESKWLPLRTIGSTIVGEFGDTAVFVGIASLFGVFPWALYLSLVLSQWLIKVFIEAIMTPFTVVVIRFLKKYENMDVVGTKTLNPIAINADGGVNIATGDQL